jgi:aryl-alcohol dehydrogenase-like predicted oxidoreductase
MLHGRLVRRSDLQRVSPLIELLGELARSHSKTPAQVALNWIVCKGALPIPGAKNPVQAAQNAGALGWRLEAGEVEALSRESERVAPLP